MSISHSTATFKRLAFPFLFALAAPAACRDEAPARPADDQSVISEAKRDAGGMLVHTVRSGFQDAPTIIKVLLPEKVEEGRRYPVLYVLPVEAGEGHRYGDGLREVKKLGLHYRHGLVCVQPTFARLPWYADHPTDAGIRQETYLLEVVLPFVERTYPVRREAGGRLLLGFSKSGWGAFSLLLRHPDVFGRAAAWDAPVAMDRPGPYGSGEIFGTRENFEKYRVSTLLEKQAERLGESSRLALLGYSNFRDQHQWLHERMVRLKVPHAYRDGPGRKHDWHSGWVGEAVDFLVGPAKGEHERNELGTIPAAIGLIHSTAQATGMTHPHEARRPSARSASPRLRCSRRRCWRCRRGAVKPPSCGRSAPTGRCRPGPHPARLHLMLHGTDVSPYSGPHFSDHRLSYPGGSWRWCDGEAEAAHGGVQGPSRPGRPQGG